MRLVVCVCLATLVAASSAAAASDPTVLVIGDSVSTAMYWYDDSIAVMQKNLGVYWDVAICRTIEGTSCPFDGERAPTLMQVVAARGTVPPTVVVEVGYNDPEETFATEVDDAMSALTAAGATHVLWLTMRESRTPYATLNGLLEKATKHWPQLELVDWNAESADHPSWFQNDNVHLTPAGGLALAHLTHAAVMQVVDPLRVPVTPLRLQEGRAYATKLRARGGTPPYRWRVASGHPPRGFHLRTNGTLITTAGHARATFTLSVTDADGTSTKLRVLEG